MTCRIHPTALIEDAVQIGDGTSIWDSVHVRGPATIGRDCIVGEKSYIAYDVTIADRVKINAYVYICAMCRERCTCLSMLCTMHYVAPTVRCPTDNYRKGLGEIVE